jgi:hypothetical protein
MFFFGRRDTTMRINLALITACALGTALIAAYSDAAHAQKLRETGFCHLANIKAQKVIYNGECKITQEPMKTGAVLITIRMGSADPFKFACRPDGSCLTGPTDVRMRDRGNGEASFRWQDFRLDVEAD